MVNKNKLNKNRTIKCFKVTHTHTQKNLIKLIEKENHTQKYSQ